MPEDLEWLKEKIREYDLLMLQLELRMDTITTAARIAHEAGVPVMLNPAPAAALSDELLSCLTYVSPNEHEAALLSGLSLKADDMAWIRGSGCGSSESVFQRNQKTYDHIGKQWCSSVRREGSDSDSLCAYDGGKRSHSSRRFLCGCILYRDCRWSFGERRRFRWQLIRRRSPYPAWEPCRLCQHWIGYVN